MTRDRTRAPRNHQARDTFKPERRRAGSRAASSQPGTPSVPENPTVNPCDDPRIAPHCERVRALVTPKRWSHILRVAQTADAIAEGNAFSEDARHAARLAAILHDAARDMSDAELLRLTPARSDAEAHHPLSIHGRAARILAERWGVTDVRVLRAIEGHTYGVPLGEPVGMAVYVADVSEPGRGVNDDIRELAKHDLQAAYKRAVESKVNYLRSRGKHVHPTTLEVHHQIAAEPS